MLKIPDEFHDIPEALKLREAETRFDACLKREKEATQRSGERVHLISEQLRQAQEELETPEVQAPVIENLKPEVKPNGRMTAPVSVDEIQDIARRAGYLEVSESDIQRAYVFGESLLTDYTV